MLHRPHIALPLLIAAGAATAACSDSSGLLDGTSLDSAAADGGVTDSAPRDSAADAMTDTGADAGEMDAADLDTGAQDQGVIDMGALDTGTSANPWSPCVGEPQGRPGFTAIANPPYTGVGQQGALQADGRVLLAGGVIPTPLGAATLFDPVSSTFLSTPGASFNDATYVAPGGHLMVRSRALAEYYDPTSASWVRTSSSAVSVGASSIVRLEDGRWVSVGGVIQGAPTDLIEIYDPNADRWSELGRLSRPRAGPTVTELEPGRLLIVGHGFRAETSSSSEWLDVATGQTQAGPYRQTRRAFPGSAVKLLDGRVLLSPDLSDSSEIYDPRTDSFTRLAIAPTPAVGPNTVLLCDGRVLRVGGRGRDAGVAWYFDPALDEWSPSQESILGTHQLAAATLLEDGSVLLFGGQRLAPNTPPRAFRFVPTP